MKIHFVAGCAVAIALVGCAPMTMRQSAQAQKIGAFEVGRVGEVAGAYAALTGKSPTIFGRICGMGKCMWVVMDSANLCISGKSYLTMLSIDNVAYREDMTCQDNVGTRIFDGDDEKITSLILGAQVIGITPPVGPPAIFRVNGAAQALEYLKRQAAQ